MINSVRKCIQAKNKFLFILYCFVCWYKSFLLIFYQQIVRNMNICFVLVAFMFAWCGCSIYFWIVCLFVWFGLIWVELIWFDIHKKYILHPNGLSCVIVWNFVAMLQVFITRKIWTYINTLIRKIWK